MIYYCYIYLYINCVSYVTEKENPNRGGWGLYRFAAGER